MMWQDLVFLVGSSFSIVVLAPTLTNRSANVPLGTSLPSAIIGLVYGMTFLSMGMTFSAVGSILAGTMWSLIAALRSPHGSLPTDPSVLRTWLTIAGDAATSGWARHRYVP